MLLTIWLATAMLQLAAIPQSLLIPATVPNKPPVTGQAGVQGYYVLAKMVSPGVFRIGKLTLNWNRSGTPDKPRDDLSINLEGLVYSGTVVCPSKGTLLQVDMTEGSANVGTQNIGVGAGAAAVRIDWDCTPAVINLVSSAYPLRAWVYNNSWLSSSATTSAASINIVSSRVCRNGRGLIARGAIDSFSGFSVHNLGFTGLFSLPKDVGSGSAPIYVRSEKIEATRNGQQVEGCGEQHTQWGAV